MLYKKKKYEFYNIVILKIYLHYYLGNSLEIVYVYYIITDLIVNDIRTISYGCLPHYDHMRIHGREIR